MADVKYLSGVRVGGTKDGTAIVLGGATETGDLFAVAIPTKEVGQTVCDLLRVVARPEFAAHAPPKQTVLPGGLREARPFRVEAVSVAQAPMMPGTALCLDFPAIDRIEVGLSLDESDRLSQQLQDAVQALRSIPVQKPS